MELGAPILAAETHLARGIGLRREERSAITGEWEEHRHDRRARGGADGAFRRNRIFILARKPVLPGFSGVFATKSLKNWVLGGFSCYPQILYLLKTGYPVISNPDPTPSGS